MLRTQIENLASHRRRRNVLLAGNKTKIVALLNIILESSRPAVASAILTKY